MTNSGIIITLAYPDTIVMVADEWYSPFLRYVGVGKKNYVRAGHAGLVLIDKVTGILEYHDFGRFITPQSHGRVRGKTIDCELDFTLSANLENEKILNLQEVLQFLATHPKLTHGDGKLIASVCFEVDYDKARSHITRMLNRGFIRYAVFMKDASNCSRFVTDTLIASVTNKSIKNKLKKSKNFTPSTVGNVLIANTGETVYEISEFGDINIFNSSVRKENIRCFLDNLNGHQPDLVGTLHPKAVDGLHEKAQWLSGIGAGAWFELHHHGSETEFRYRRISPNGNIDVDCIYGVNDPEFNYNETFEFMQYSNCEFFHIKQNEIIYRFERLATSLRQKKHLT